MKAFIYLLCFCFGTIVHGQLNGYNLKYDVLDPNTAGKIFHNPQKEIIRPEGNPYVTTNFQWAQVAGVAQKARMRLNAYADEFEFITPKGDTLALDKLSDFSPIVFPDIPSKYVLSTYTLRNGKNYTGYLKELYVEGKFSLYSKHNITYYEGKEAKTTLETARPAKYAAAQETYFLKKEMAGIFTFPENKKQLLLLFPSQKAAIESYVKEEQIDFKVMGDRIKILRFLNGL